MSTAARSRRTATIIAFPETPRKRNKLRRDADLEVVLRAIKLGLMCVNPDERKLIEALRLISLPARKDVLKLVESMTRTHPYYLPSLRRGD